MSSPNHRVAPATLYIVSTPIGNLRDITLRALDVLRDVAIVAAEDTRQSRKLLSAFELKKKLVSLHSHSRNEKIEGLVERLLEGASVAYVTDAGSPAVSDPGVRLVARAHESGIQVRVIPGPSALTGALAVAGLPCADVRFLGFLPRSRGRRRTQLQEVLSGTSTLVFFESPNRIARLLEDLRDLAGDRVVALCRELTKLHEEVLRGTAGELLASLPESPRGEFSVVVEPGTTSPVEIAHKEIVGKVQELLNAGLSTRDATKAVAAATGEPRKEVYRRYLESQKAAETDTRSDDEKS